MSRADWVLEQLGDLRDQAGVRALAEEMLAFFDDAVAGRLRFTAEVLRKKEAVLRHPYRTISRQTARLMWMAARELAVPERYAGIAALGPIRDVFPEPSPLTPAMQRGAARADALEAGYFAWRVTIKEALPAHEAAGEILLLCVLRGGLLDESTLDALGHQPLPRWQWTCVTGEEPLDQPWHGIPAEAALAASYFAQLHPTHSTLLGPNDRVAHVIDAVLKKCWPGEPPSLAVFLGWARDRLRRDAPDWIVRLNIGDLHDVPAQSGSLFRLITDWPLLTPPPTTPSTEVPAAIDFPVVEPPSGLPSWITSKNYLDDLRGRLKRCPDSRSALAEVTQSIDAAPDPLCGMVVALAQSWLRAKTPPKPGSVVRYLSSLRKLPEAAAVQSPFVSHDGELEADIDVWAQVLTTAAQPQFRSDDTTLKELHRLHRFACKRFPSLEDCDLDAIDGMEVTVRTRAVLVTDREMRDAGDWLVEHFTDDAPCLLCGEVAYATGARLRELMFARLSDLHMDGDETILKIRPLRDRSLKTPAARRDLPLHGLMPADALARLRERAKALEVLGQDPRNIYLFASLDAADSPPTMRQALLIVEALRVVTGDPGITFHALRHSAINWLLLEILAYEVPAIRALPLRGMDTSRFTKNAIHARVHMLCGPNHDAPADRLPGAWTQAFARLVGHSHFAVTLRHYSHLRPLYQPLVLVREWGDLPVAVLSRISGLPERTLRDRAVQWRAADPIARATAPRADAARGWQHARDVMALPRKLIPAMPANASVAKREILKTVSVPLACRLLATRRSSAQIADLFGCHPLAITRIDQALSPKIVENQRAPAFDPPNILAGKKDIAHFHALAQALDRHPPSAAAMAACARIIDIDKRWIVSRDDDAVQLVGFLLSLLPEEAVLYIELQLIDATREPRSVADREASYRQLFGTRWASRIVIKAYAESEGPTWRYRPVREKVEGDTEWIALRICDQAPDGLSTVWRSPGYTRALHCWRLARDLRTPVWANYNRPGR